MPANREVNTNFPQQKPIVTRTHSPVKEKKNYGKIRIFCEDVRTYI